jgi:hypothetical protein
VQESAFYFSIETLPSIVKNPGKSHYLPTVLVVLSDKLSGLLHILSRKRGNLPPFRISGFVVTETGAENLTEMHWKALIIRGLSRLGPK